MHPDMRIESMHNEATPLLAAQDVKTSGRIHEHSSDLKTPDHSRHSPRHGRSPRLHNMHPAHGNPTKAARTLLLMANHRRLERSAQPLPAQKGEESQGSSWTTWGLETCICLVDCRDILVKMLMLLSYTAIVLCMTILALGTASRREKHALD